jgi:hypothetical protein
MSQQNVEEDDSSAFQELLLCESLVATLQHPRHARASWVTDEVESLRRLTLSDDEDSLYWMDEDCEKLNIAFPAILDMDGSFERSDPYFSVRDCRSVSIYLEDLKKNQFLMFERQ